MTKVEIISRLDNTIKCGHCAIEPTKDDSKPNILTKEQWHAFMANDVFRLMVHAGKLIPFASSKAKPVSEKTAPKAEDEKIVKSAPAPKKGKKV